MNAPTSPLVPDIDPVACRALWCAVLAEHWNLAIPPSQYERSADVAAARNWFGTSSFHQVCEMAGVDGDDLLRAYQAARAPGAEFRLGLQKQNVQGASR